MQCDSDIKVQYSSKDLVYRNGKVSVSCHLEAVVRIYKRYILISAVQFPATEFPSALLPNW
jgi:hypothetical protein